MLLRRYGSTIQSVEPNFDARAITEIAFRRIPLSSLPLGEFEEQYERVRGVELSSNADGDVKDDVEQALLANLLDQLNAVLTGLAPAEVLMVESEAGRDYPKTRDKTRTKVIAGQNRFHFEWTVDPPLRLGVYRRR
jgi:hypothetical protein